MLPVKSRLKSVRWDSAYYRSETLCYLDELEDTLTHLRYEGKPSLGKNLKRTKNIIKSLKKNLNRHLMVEEGIFFPYVVKHIPKLESIIRFLHLEHQDVIKSFDRMSSLLEQIDQHNQPAQNGKIVERAHDQGYYFICLLRHHVEDESNRIFRVIEKELNRKEKEHIRACLDGRYDGKL
ncbi:MAG: hypothetical protein COV74_10735 [Candidatus Omnitrophica bacterium CG11_big_fil_rev_8_21_14_0_20_45_26]|uniref:Hemerythrin-like domain-containing protein n=1 Tax=Candidatus Abzuiibacterium crystallinum TaxID=1974748 RepID=A0A2H0LN13_9BACT|nr:MAG: hypothetical protein COV74_10735 [Candidatus Omnitrophica bacterium CG11_big_fil_rev_8_21_14_0_20_45_26]PIW63859.1 MAG: hypothetical protein COW12_08075 [Candidatus Omnitrophica bacterium CG12_big_fil_rev_8_21_14_0_65_45_16]